MPLSEHEQRLLDEIERALYAEDPKFASTFKGARARRPSRRRRVQGIALFVVGIALLVLGVMLPAPAGIPVVSVAGFLLMFVGSLLTLASMRKKEPDGEPSAGGQEAGRTSRGRSSFAQRMEERFRRRFEDD
ncbi:DUF3040 domain-containing protein [Goodfellowiella coeruleoviolacea]|uniref:DUF3040 domain-containing protein n=1 Tax=Goodfellowiella coeruleoviolacea TaxID=334858 RepID=A0AAE3GJW4_9PSEU|nr:DUF3040 domain-containing protein [Goodfellowiella coeruleoviolacea]MCP2169556.1 Protein of unknown function (DUF3040) [Goodfellowiella coeruleoviolacea]